MNDPNEIPQAEQEALRLGMMLGQRRAFGMIAGHCSAAHAESIRQIRDGKLYLRFAENWSDYCERYLKMSKRNADYIIALEKELGAIYFVAAELTGCSARVFRKIRAAFQDDGIHAGGQVIALIPENADRAIEAVAQLQAEAEAAQGPPKPDAAERRFAALEKRACQLADAFRREAKDNDLIERQWLIGKLRAVRQLFDRLDLEIR
jgi:hypothetical protein